MSPVPSKADIIQAILTNQSLTDSEKSILVDEFINEIKKEYPDLKNHTTKSDLTDLQLELTKEIKNLDLKLSKEITASRAELKDLDLKLTTDIKNLDLKLSKEITASRAELKNLDLKLTTDIKNLDLKLTKEITASRAENKDLDLKLSKEIATSKSETIKWVAGMLFVQVLAITGVFFTAFKLFLPVAN